jgi:hypothetical protein
VKTAQTDKSGRDVLPSVNLDNLSDDELLAYHELLKKANAK